MLLMVEKGIRGGICHSIFRYAKANNKYMKENNLHLHIFNIGMLIIYIDGKCCKSFQWIKEWISEILSGSKRLLSLIITSYKTVMKKLMKDIFLKLVFNILKNYMNFIKIYHFHQKE